MNSPVCQGPVGSGSGSGWHGGSYGGGGAYGGGGSVILMLASIMRRISQLGLYDAVGHTAAGLVRVYAREQARYRYNCTS
jgi:hypothetical protein